MDVAAVIDLYCRAWRSLGSRDRFTILETSLAEDVIYMDPTVDVQGLSALNTHIDGTMARYPGAKIVRTSQVDIHHGTARFAWAMILENGRALPEGLDVINFDRDTGKITRILGFFGPLRGLPDEQNT